MNFFRFSSETAEWEEVFTDEIEGVKVEGRLFNCLESCCSDSPEVFYFVVILGNKKGIPGAEKATIYSQCTCLEEELHSKVEEMMKDYVKEWKETHFDFKGDQEWMK